MADLPFERAEYRDRARRVREEMARRGVDVLYVMSPANILYLSGFESIWYPPRAPLGVVLRRDDERLTFLDYGRHETLVAMTAHYDDAVFFDYTDAVETVVGAFRANGWTDGTVGIERYTKSPAGPLVDRMAGALADAGAEIVPGDWIVDRVRLVKSPAELERVRRASGIVDAAFEALHDYVRPGRTELQV
jgi:Xaa-Pro aminopeptidase